MRPVACLLLMLLAPLALAGTGQEELTARVILPPPELVRGGGTITGRVIVDPPASAPQGEPAGVSLEGIIVDVSGKRVITDKTGKFVFSVPDRVETFWVRIPAIAADPDHGLLAIGQVNNEVLVGFDESRLPRLQASQCLAPAGATGPEPYILHRIFPEGGNGLETSATVGRQDAPLLWKTDRAAAFDFQSVGAGPEVFTLREKGAVVATGGVSVVSLSATADRAALRHGERTNFTVIVSGIPKEWTAPRDREGVRLHYTNNTPSVGRFDTRPDDFFIDIRSDSTAVQVQAPDAGALAASLQEYASPGRAPVFESPEFRSAAADVLQTISFRDQQRYIGVTPGSYDVRVVVDFPVRARQPRPIWVRTGDKKDLPLLFQPAVSSENVVKGMIEFWQPSR